MVMRFQSPLVYNRTFSINSYLDIFIVFSWKIFWRCLTFDAVFIIKADCLLVCSIRSPRGLMILDYNWIPRFHLVIFLLCSYVLLTFLLNAYVGYADYIKKLF